MLNGMTAFFMALSIMKKYVRAISIKNSEERRRYPPLVLASSTNIISLRYLGGVLLITLCTVLKRVDHASL